MFAAGWHCNLQGGKVASGKVVILDIIRGVSVSPLRTDCLFPINPATYQLLDQQCLAISYLKTVSLPS